MAVSEQTARRIRNGIKGQPVRRRSRIPGGWYTVIFVFGPAAIAATVLLVKAVRGLIASYHQIVDGVTAKVDALPPQHASSTVLMVVPVHEMSINKTLIVAALVVGAMLLILGYVMMLRPRRRR